MSSNYCLICDKSYLKLLNQFECDHLYCNTCLYYSLFYHISSILKNDINNSFSDISDKNSNSSNNKIDKANISTNYLRSKNNIGKENHEFILTINDYFNCFICNEISLKPLNEFLYNLENFKNNVIIDLYNIENYNKVEANNLKELYSYDVNFNISPLNNKLNDNNTSENIQKNIHDACKNINTNYTEDKIKNCQSCLENSISNYCYNCKIYYCYDCIENKHNKIKKFALNHYISECIIGKSNLNFCNCLKQRIVLYNCLSCNTNMCEICFVVYHLKHDVKSIVLKHDKIKEKTKTELNSEILKSLNYDEIISTIDTFINHFTTASCKYTKNITELFVNFKIQLEKTINEIQLMYKNICKQESNNVSFIIEIIKRQISRIKFSQKLIIEFVSSTNKNNEIDNLINSESLNSLSVNKNIHKSANIPVNIKAVKKNIYSNKEKFKILNINNSACSIVDPNNEEINCKQNNIEEKLNICKTVYNANEFIEEEFKHNLLNAKSIENTANKRVSIKNGRVSFLGDKVKCFKKKALIIKSSTLYNEIYSNMIVVFRDNNDNCWIGYINNKDYCIELININEVKNFKDFNGLSTTDLILENRHNEYDKLYNDNKTNRYSTINYNSDLKTLTCKSLTPKQSNNISTSKYNTSNNNKLNANNKSKLNSLKINNKSVSIKGNNKFNKISNSNNKTNNNSINTSKYNKEYSNKHFSLKGHQDTIYGIKYYKFDNDEFLLSFSEDKTIKLWSCKYLQEILSIIHEKSVKTASILIHNNCKYIIVGSFTNNYPIGVYSLRGSFVKQIKIKGCTNFIETYSCKEGSFIFASTYNPYELSVYDYETDSKLYYIKLETYINSLIVNKFEAYVVTTLDRNGNLMQFELFHGTLIFNNNSLITKYSNTNKNNSCIKQSTLKNSENLLNKVTSSKFLSLEAKNNISDIEKFISNRKKLYSKYLSSFVSYNISKWNDRYYIFCGNGTGFAILDINKLLIVNEYQYVNNNIVKDSFKFLHHKYGEIIITIGQDSAIYVLN